MIFFDLQLWPRAISKNITVRGCVYTSFPPKCALFNCQEMVSPIKCGDLVPVTVKHVILCSSIKLSSCQSAALTSVCVCICTHCVSVWFAFAPCLCQHLCISLCMTAHCVCYHSQERILCLAGCQKWQKQNLSQCSSFDHWCDSPLKPAGSHFSL